MPQFADKQRVIHDVFGTGTVQIAFSWTGQRVGFTRIALDNFRDASMKKIITTNTDGWRARDVVTLNTDIPDSQTVDDDVLDEDIRATEHRPFTRGEFLRHPKFGYVRVDDVTRTFVYFDHGQPHKGPAINRTVHRVSDVFCDPDWQRVEPRAADGVVTLRLGDFGSSIRSKADKTTEKEFVDFLGLKGRRFLFGESAATLYRALRLRKGVHEETGDKES